MSCLSSCLSKFYHVNQMSIYLPTSTYKHDWVRWLNHYWLTLQHGLTNDLPNRSYFRMECSWPLFDLYSNFWLTYSIPISKVWALSFYSNFWLTYSIPISKVWAYYLSISLNHHSDWRLTSIPLLLVSHSLPLVTVVVIGLLIKGIWTYLSERSRSWSNQVHVINHVNHHVYLSTYFYL
jgi:hypothetical protein